MGVLTQQIGHLRSFERIFNKLRGEFGRKVIADEVLQRDRDLFKFALLSTGVFLHKWDGSLRQLVGIRYKIVNEERWAQLPDGLKDEGFELSKTLTRQVLKLDELPKRSLPDGFIKNFTIDTALGRWCPAEIWGEVANPESDAYLEAFKMATTDQILADLVGAATERQKELIHEGFIAPVEDDHLGNWARRIKSLRDTPERLARLHTGWEAFEMPFDAKCKDQIDDLFESLEASLEARNHENWVTRAVRDCIQSKSLVRLDMDEEATCLLRNDRA